MSDQKYFSWGGHETVVAAGSTFAILEQTPQSAHKCPKPITNALDFGMSPTRDSPARSHSGAAVAMWLWGWYKGIAMQAMIHCPWLHEWCTSNHVIVRSSNVPNSFFIIQMEFIASLCDQQSISKPYCRQKKSNPFRGRSCFVPYLLHPIEPNKMVDRT